jgi:hypothetical protein
MELAHENVVLALLGAAAGLGGLTLVFLGLVVSSYQAFGTDTTKKIRGRYRRNASLVLVAFVVSLVTVVLAVSWLIQLHEHESLYVATVVAFMAQLGSLLIATGFVVAEVVWGD